MASLYVYQDQVADPAVLLTSIPHIRDTSNLFNNSIWYWFTIHTSIMSPEVKFTPYGIPYLVEFANVAFRKRSKSGSSSLAPTVGASTSTLNLSHAPSSRYNGSTTTLNTSHGHGSSRYNDSMPTLVITPPESEGEGLLIQFATHQATPYHRLSETRLARLKYRIANAVVAAGMDAPSPRTASPPSRCVSHGRIHTSDLRRAGDPSAHPAPSSLYQGTYGQVMSAFRSAGLTTTPCDQFGFAEGNIWH